MNPFVLVSQSKRFMKVVKIWQIWWIIQSFKIMFDSWTNYSIYIAISIYSILLYLFIYDSNEPVIFNEQDKKFNETAFCQPFFFLKQAEKNFEWFSNMAPKCLF